MKLISAAAIVFALVICASAQVERPKNEVAVWGGYSPDSTTAFRIFGRTPDAKFGIVSIRYSRRFNNGKWVNMKYTVDLTPLAVIKSDEPLTSPSQRSTAFGFGAAPLGVQANFRPRSRVQPYVGLSGGFLYFNRRVLGESGTRFTFTADLGGGVEIRTGERRSVSIGYKYFHVSNWNRGEINPGIDNNVIYVGYTLFSK